MSLLCRAFGHPYRISETTSDPDSTTWTCKRCGDERTVEGIRVSTVGPSKLKYDPDHAEAIVQ